MPERPRLFLIDGSSYIYRAFYAIGHLSNSKGLPTNAVYGFTTMLLKIVRDQRPDYLAVAFDAKGPTLRHAEYQEYKAQRPEMPDSLSRQIPYIHRVVEAFRIPSGSMEKTLLIGDFLFVNKTLYGAEIPLTNKHLPPVREPKRLDIVVFRSPEDPATNVVKRVIGMPGDTLGMKDNVLQLNGKPVDEPYVIRTGGEDLDTRQMLWQVKYLAGRDPSTYRPTLKNRQEKTDDSEQDKTPSDQVNQRLSGQGHHRFRFLPLVKNKPIVSL